MAVRKRQVALTAKQRYFDVWRRQVKPPQSDVDGHAHEALAELARETGQDVSDLLDDWGEAAARREYDGGHTRDEAERLALEDTREIALLRMQRSRR